MDFKYSYLVPTSEYRTDGLDCGIPLRMHKDPNAEKRGTLRCQDDWARHVKAIPGYHGNLGEPYSFMRVTVPECLPERLEIIGYANEFAFIYDDEMENLDLKSFQEGRDEMLNAFTVDALNMKPSGANVRPEKKLQAQILKEMMAIDPQRAVTTMKSWATFVKLASKTRSTPFETLDEYLPSRITDAGELVWFGTMTFGMGLTIPDSEYALCMRLARSGYAAFALTNDLYSWRKERRAARTAGQDYVFNAIWVIMKERGCTEEEAIDICRSEIKRHVAIYEGIAAEVIKGADGEYGELSADTKKYLIGIKYSHVGNLVWSIYCPRYHAGLEDEEGDGEGSSGCMNGNGHANSGA